MRGAGLSTEMTQGNRKTGTQRKASEPFLSWKEVDHPQRKEGGATTSASKLGAGKRKKDLSPTSIPRPGGPVFLLGGRGLHSVGGSPLRSSSPNTVRNMEDDWKSSKGTSDHRESKRLQRTMGERGATGSHGQFKDLHRVEGKLKSAGVHAPSPLRKRCVSPPTSDDEIHVSGGEAADNEDINVVSPEAFPEQQPHLSVLTDEGLKENNTWESDEEGPLVEEGREAVNEDNAIEVHNITLAEETTKRRERRQAQAMREREGLRRKKEGLPMNFLLVDEHSMKPYGVGVGDWKKELHVLSKNLDPAIGNINQQLQGAVEEIADWIQHTWEYSSPIKFAYVKEVIARGVTLRRADLWKKLRNEEEKPDGLSDRSWRTLERQLQSPATIRKSQSCSKANASRVNFGRTGPSGEVGVRERLRRQLRRSPDPEEIGFEMARNKGYGGRYKQKKEYMNVMHDGKGVGQLALEDAPIIEHSDNSYRNMRSTHDHDEDDVGGGHRKNDESLSQEKRSPVLLGRSIQQVSAEEVAEHPLVMKMMKRLEALEGRQASQVNSKSNSAENDMNGRDVEQRTRYSKRRRTAAKEKGDEVDHEYEEGEHISNRRSPEMSGNDLSLKCSGEK